MKISISDINQYQRCKRAWDISSGNRQSLKHKTTPIMAFVIGSGVHAAIEAQANGDDPLEAFEEYVHDERSSQRSFYESQVGTTPWASEMEKFEQSVNLARTLVKQYFAHYGDENPLEDQGLKYIATEIPFSIELPLVDHAGKPVHFVGTFDAIATDIETESKFFLVENKTSGRKPNLDLIQGSNQFVGYNWAFRALTGHATAGTLYNCILKKEIKSPRVLQSGKLSTDKTANVTLKTFLAAIQYGGHEPTQYLGYLKFLEERERSGDDRFFLREKFHYTHHQLDEWYSEVLRPVAQEMVGEPYPSPNYASCEGCLVKDLCDAMKYGDDVQTIIDNRYEVKTYGTMEAVDGITPTPVGSAEEIVNLLRGNNG